MRLTRAIERWTLSASSLLIPVVYNAAVGRRNQHLFAFHEVCALVHILFSNALDNPARERVGL